MGSEDLGYSVSWQIVKFHEYGLPQFRTRLIILAAGPGDELPILPPRTHAKNGPKIGLKALQGPEAVWDNIPEDAPNQEERGVNRRKPDEPDSKRQWDINMPIQCIMTAGAQSFLYYYKFAGNNLTKGIGNVVPPSSAEMFLCPVAEQNEIRGILAPSRQKSQTDSTGPTHKREKEKTPTDQNINEPFIREPNTSADLLPCSNNSKVRIAIKFGICIAPQSLCPKETLRDYISRHETRNAGH
ncbi:hypothetical protein B0J14DRAFT_571266 [Halenospora varia]|nr:hypothetical protein B0J14DRAFT_571266 [Halenospora varia]